MCRAVPRARPSMVSKRPRPESAGWLQRWRAPAGRKGERRRCHPVPAAWKPRQSCRGDSLTLAMIRARGSDEDRPRRSEARRRRSPSRPPRPRNPPPGLAAGRVQFRTRLRRDHRLGQHLHIGRNHHHLPDGSFADALAAHFGFIRAEPDAECAARGCSWG